MPRATVAYVRAIVCNLTRNRHRHLRVVRLRTPAARHEDSSEQAVILREDHRDWGTTVPVTSSGRQPMDEGQALSGARAARFAKAASVAEPGAAQ